MTHSDPQHGSGGYEHGDAAVRPVVLFTLGLAALLVVTALSMVGLFRALDERERADESRPHPMADDQLPPAPRLQTATSDDLQAHRAREAKLLHEYAWIDPQAGIVRIPIERALELTAERGLPARK